MTPNQSKVRKAYLDLHKGDLPPSIREVCDHTGLGMQSVHSAIEELVEMGLMIEDKTRWRRKYRAVGAFDIEALNQMPHADLLALQHLIEQRLRGRKLAA